MSSSPGSLSLAPMMLFSYPGEGPVASSYRSGRPIPCPISCAAVHPELSAGHTPITPPFIYARLPSPGGTVISIPPRSTMITSVFTFLEPNFPVQYFSIPPLNLSTTSSVNPAPTKIIFSSMLTSSPVFSNRNRIFPAFDPARLAARPRRIQRVRAGRLVRRPLLDHLHRRRADFVPRVQGLAHDLLPEPVVRPRPAVHIPLRFPAALPAPGAVVVATVLRWSWFVGQSEGRIKVYSD